MNTFKITALQTAFLMAVLTAASKFIGFIREIIMANYYGTSYVTDAFVMANAVPSILFGGILSAVATAYMPIFSKIFELEGLREANRYTSSIINILLILGAVSSLVGLLFSEQIMMIFAGGFTGDTAVLTNFFLKITFSYVLATAIIAILNAYLQYRGVFISQIIIGYSQSLFLIIFIVVSAYTKHHFIILGYICAYIFQIIIYYILARKKNYRYSFTLNSSGYIRQIVALSIPVFIGSMANQIGQFVDKTLASGLPLGSVAALNYGILLTGLITGLTVTIMNSMLYPKLNRTNALKDYVKFKSLINSGLIFIIIITIPCALGAMVYNQQIVQVVYERGAFDSSATLLTATAFLYYSLGIPFNSIVSLFAIAFYSMHDTKTPAIIGAIIVLVGIIFNLLLIKPMAHGGLALATSIGAAVGVALYFLSFKKKYPEITLIENWGKIIKIILSAIVSIAASLLSYKIIITTLAGLIYIRMIQLMVAVAVAVVIYYFMLRLFKIEEVKMLRQLINYK